MARGTPHDQLASAISKALEEYAGEVTAGTKEAVKEAEEDYFIATEKYKAGEGIMLDIIDAQTALSTARQNYISAQYDYARYRASVESDMGYDVHPSTATVENAVLK